MQSHNSRPRYLGDSSIAFEQYSKYVEPNNQPLITKSRRESTYEEFSKYLNDVSIKSDDVSSVLNVSTTVFQINVNLVYWNHSLINLLYIAISRCPCE